MKWEKQRKETESEKKQGCKTKQKWTEQKGKKEHNTEEERETKEGNRVKEEKETKRNDINIKSISSYPLVNAYVFLFHNNI